MVVLVVDVLVGDDEREADPDLPAPAGGLAGVVVVGAAAEMVAAIAAAIGFAGAGLAAGPTTALAAGFATDRKSVV